MGSPITFSGFNNIDFSLILNAVMEQERAPVKALQSRHTALEKQNTALATFGTKLGALQSAMDALASVDSLAHLAATSTDTASVGVATTSGTVEGTYDVIVTELVRAQVTTSAQTFTSPDAVVATGGALQFQVGSGTPVDVAITGSTTLRKLAETINATKNSPVSASVVQSAPGSYRLVLTGTATGVENAFTFTSSLTGGEGLAFTDGDGDNVFGEATDSNTQTALDAALTVNSLPITSSSNKVENVIPGVTLTLLKKDSARTVTIGVSRDPKEPIDLLKKLVTAYNDVTTFFKDQTNAAVAGQASIGRDPIVRSLRDTLRRTLQAEYADGGAYTHLAGIGLGFDTSGKLKLDEKVFKAALADSPADVQRLLSGTNGKGGAVGALTTLVKSYTEAGGLVADARSRNDEQMRSLTSRIDTIESQLSLRRLALQREFIAADMAMSQLKNQSSSLAGLGNQYRLF